jgi:D-ribose pyranose/furanose isomerase RbsD
MENTNNNIFLKIDLCDERVYEILNLLNREKYIQIVCTELPIPKNQENIDIFTNYMGVDITQNILKKMKIKNPILLLLFIPEFVPYLSI